jgi:hypothetical protein
MTMANNSAVPVVGVEVYTADGDKLGTVKEIEGRCFKVDAPIQRDYWLASDAIAGSSGGGIRLSFTKDRLGDEKVDSPEHTGLHRHDAN